MPGVGQNGQNAVQYNPKQATSSPQAEGAIWAWVPPGAGVYANRRNMAAVAAGLR